MQKLSGGAGGYCRPGRNIYGRPYWCSRNTFAARNCRPCTGAARAASSHPFPLPALGSATAKTTFHYKHVALTGDQVT